MNGDEARPFHCDHLRVRLVRRTLRNGAQSFVRQCLRCGRSTGSVKKDQLSQQDRDRMDAFDEELEERWRKEQERLLKAERDEESRRWWAAYNLYLSSPRWRAKRDLVLARAKHRCEGCALATAVQVHHLTYERVGNEMLFDLVAVCLKCHEAIHRDDQPTGTHP